MDTAWAQVVHPPPGLPAPLVGPPPGLTLPAQAPRVPDLSKLPQLLSDPLTFVSSAHELLSIGSVFHNTGNCKPCAWFWKPLGCENSHECQHCHLCPEGAIRTRKKAIKSLRAEAKTSAELELEGQIQEESLVEAADASAFDARESPTASTSADRAGEAQLASLLEEEAGPCESLGAQLSDGIVEQTASLDSPSGHLPHGGFAPRGSAIPWHRGLPATCVVLEGRRVREWQRLHLARLPCRVDQGVALGEASKQGIEQGQRSELQCHR